MILKGKELLKDDDAAESEKPFRSHIVGSVRGEGWDLGGGNFDDSRSIVARISTPPTLTGDK